MKGSEFEVLEILAYHDTVFQEIRLQGEISEFLALAPILSAIRRKRGFFSTNTKLRILIRTVGNNLVYLNFYKTMLN